MGNTTSDYGDTNSNYGRRGRISEMRPSELRFTHDSVSGQFRDGHSMDETLRQVLNGTIPISSIPPLVVMRYRGEWYVVRGNRRLYLYQLLEKNGKIQYVKVLQKDFDEDLFNKQFTSRNNGRSIRLRGDPLLEQRLLGIMRQQTASQSNADWCIIQ